MRRSKLVLIVTILVAISLLAGTGTNVRAAAPVKVRWYVGLGTGSEATKIPDEQAVVKKFNDTHSDIELDLEVVANAQAYDALNTEIASGNAPDIVGPIGIRARSSFPGDWLDLTQLIADNKYDLSAFDPATVKFLQVPGQGQLGIPFGIYPSFLFVNTDLFDEAGLAYPPTKIGDPYIDKKGNKLPWNLDTVRTLAMQLTVDKSGKTPTDAAFNADQIVQFGFGQQYTDVRGQCTMFGAGNFVATDGKTAQIPDNWKACIDWLQKAMWVDHFYPNGPYGGSDVLNKGDWFTSGNIAMDQVHTWYLGGLAGMKFKWNIFAMPAYNDKTTAKLHADTFGIMKTTKVPKEAFTVLTYLVGDAAPDLTTLYGAMPARLSLQKGYFDALAATDAMKGMKLNNDVITDAAKYNDQPNHEEWMPDFLESSDRYTKFVTQLNNDAKFDAKAGEAQLVTDLQKLFDTGKK